MGNLINGDSLLRSVIEAVPSPLFILNKNLEIVDHNKAGVLFVGPDAEILLMRLCGEALHCFHEQEAIEKCGKTEFCKDCVFRNVTEDVWKGKAALRKKYKFRIKRNGKTATRYLHVSSSPLEYKNELFAILIIEDATELEEIRQIIPICSICKNIRNDDSYWDSVEKFINDHSGIQLTHSICPECAKKHYPDMDLYDE
jgi:PAS domain-containing protein